MGPELPTPAEEKAIAEMIETNIDFATEKRREVICNVCDGSGYIKSNTIEYEGDCPECSVD